MANNQSVRRHLDSFTRGRIIGKLEEGRSVTIGVLLLLDASLSSILAHTYTTTTATQIIGIEYTHNKNNYGLTATPRFRPLPPSELGGEEEGRESRVRIESEPKVALAAQSYPHAHACPNHADIHLGTYNPTRCVSCLPKAPDITQNVFKTGHSFVRFTQIRLTGLT
ncbi:hypothetical protein TNCV_5102271 [Trichonephila clavipes]|nr:hypothetical protein TNCV_5102271 [Trichonephila clavipes]